MAFRLYKKYIKKHNVSKGYIMFTLLGKGLYDAISDKKTQYDILNTLKYIYTYKCIIICVNVFYIVQMRLHMFTYILNSFN